MPPIKILKKGQKLETEIDEIDRILTPFREYVNDAGRGDCWRLRNKFLFLVFYSHFNKNVMREHLLTKGGISKLFVVPVIARINTYTLVYVKYNIVIDTRLQNYFDFYDEEDEVNITGIPFFITNEKQAAIVIKILTSYNNKLDEFDKDSELKEVATEEKSIASLIWECETEEEALVKYVKKVGDSLGVKAIWESRPNAPESKEEQANDGDMFKFQHILWEILIGENWNYRRLIWIIDPDGGKGKSTFCKKFRKEHGGVVLKTLCGATHIATLMNERKKAGLKTPYILVDLPRAAETHKMWDTVECLMDGILTVQKYKGAELPIDLPRIIIFANWSPFDAPDDQPDEETGITVDKKKIYPKKNLKKSTVSKDRWNFGNIVPYHKKEDYDKTTLIVDEEKVRYSGFYNAKWRRIIKECNKLSNSKESIFVNGEEIKVEEDEIDLSLFYNFMRLLLLLVIDRVQGIDWGKCVKKIPHNLIPCTLSDELINFVVEFNALYNLAEQNKIGETKEEILTDIFQYGHLNYNFEPTEVNYTIFCEDDIYDKESKYKIYNKYKKIKVRDEYTDKDVDALVFDENSEFYTIDVEFGDIGEENYYEVVETKNKISRILNKTLRCSDIYPDNYTIEWKVNPDYKPDFDKRKPPAGIYHFTTKEELEVRRRT